MLVIAHRGNINGPVPAMENKPEYIRKSLLDGYQVEIDVWYNQKHDHLTLGHNLSQHVISKDFLKMNGLWCHAKNIDALMIMNDLNVKHFFYHERDSYTLTSSHFIWTFPGEEVTKRSIVMFPEKIKPKMYKNCYGVCTDYAERY